MASGQQIPLNIQLSDEATFANFFVVEGSANAQALAAVRQLCQLNRAQLPDKVIYLWGGQGVGLSHILQAACHETQSLGQRCQYLPLEDLAGFDPLELLEGLEALDLVCLDGLQHVLGRAEWDKALFNLYNRIQAGTGRLLLSGVCAPKDVSCTLPDLSSRLAWGLTYRLEPLNDAEKQQALQKRAALRGLDMSGDVARFILTHTSREPGALFACLDQLDKKSLAEKRRLSIPLVKEVLGL